MKYLVNVQTKEILKEAKSIGQEWVDSQIDLELLDLENVILENSLFRKLTDDEIAPVLNNNINKQIKQLENSLIGPIREMLSTVSTSNQKLIAQNKIDTVEQTIQQLRGRLV